MKAKLTTYIVGPMNYRPGDVVEGDLAEELVSVGFATVIFDPVEKRAEGKPAKAVTRQVK